MVTKMNEHWPHLIRTNWHEEYPRYLRSPEWKVKRKAAMDACGGRCKCGAIATEVHHKSSASVGDEDMEHLEGICSQCHQDIHKIEGKERRKPPTRVSTAVFKRKSKQKPKKRRRKRRKSTEKILKGVMRKGRRRKSPYTKKQKSKRKKTSKLC